MNIFLIGSRGSGKTTVGRVLAKRLNWSFIDIDQMIIESTGCSIRQTFALEGEQGFRQRERDACLRVKKVDEHVVSLGGGTVCVPENYTSLKRSGRFVWLRTPAAIAWSRIQQDPQGKSNRPDLTPTGGLSELEALLVEREPKYEAAAHHIVDTVSDTPEQIAEAIELWFVASDTGR